MSIFVNVNKDLEINVESDDNVSIGNFKMVFDVTKETGMIPLSTDSMERELVKKYQKNQDPEILKEIIKCSMRITLVSLKDIVLRNLNKDNIQFIDFKEVFKTAFKGVKRAANKFKTEKNDRFTACVIQSLYASMQKKIIKMIDKKIVQPEYTSKENLKTLDDLLDEIVPNLK